MTYLMLMTLLPLILFVVIDYYFDLKRGIWAAIASSVLMAAVYWVIFKELDYEIIIVITAVLATGLLSIKKNDGIFFKFQPVITNAVWVLIISYFQFFDTPILIKFLPKMKMLMPPEQFSNFDNPVLILMFQRMSMYLIVWISIHSCLVAYAALRLKNSHWLLIKSFGFVLVTLGCFMTELVFQQFSS
ncbi:MAG: septation protein IspZ [Bdellovibrionota bacterium]